MEFINTKFQKIIAFCMMGAEKGGQGGLRKIQHTWT